MLAVPASSMPPYREVFLPFVCFSVTWVVIGGEAEGSLGQCLIPVQGLVPASFQYCCCRASGPGADLGPVGDAPSSLSPIVDATPHPCGMGY